MTYKELATALGFKAARPARFALWTIQERCEDVYPPLTSIVVYESTDKPGSGFKQRAATLQEDQNSVFNFPWDSVPVPFSAGHREQLVQKDHNGDQNYEVPDFDVYVNGRGAYQNVFRKELMRNYGRQCALCDSRLESMLVASHIMPWSLDRANRLNPRNGILLCRTHDGCLECGIIRISMDLNISVRTDVNGDSLGYDLHEFVTKHTHKTVRAPKRHAPDPKLIQGRADLVLTKANPAAV